MSLRHFIDISSLLEPISENSPHGSDVREDRSPESHYYTLKDARNDGRAAERSAMFDVEADTIGPWQTVIAEAQIVLKEQAKDIEVTCWLIEGLIRLHGFVGLRDGMQLLEKLIDKYWDNLYPRPDEDGIETKVLPITGLNGESGEGTLLAPMRNTPLSEDYADQPFTYWEYLQARNADQIKDNDEKAARVDALGYSLKSIENSITNSDAQFCTDLLATLEEIQTSYKAITATLRKHCGHDAPPSSNISKLLEEIIRTGQFIFAKKIIVAQPELEASLEAEQAGGDAMSPTSSSATTAMMVREGAIVDREDALRRLNDIAEYFRRYEPHTPIGPGIERIIKWGRMTVADLMMELLPDEQAKGIYSQLTGVALDGSDTKAYVAPPSPKAAAKSATTQTNSNTAEAAKEATPQKKLGW